MHICEYCGKHFDQYNSYKGHKAKCVKFREYVENTLTKEILEKWFYEEKLSAHYISKNILNETITAKRIIDECRKVGIKTWSIKESNNLDTTKNKRKETCLEIYGAENCLSKNTKAYKKRNKTVKSKYGVSNVFATDSVKNKIKETCLEKYGVENYVQSQEYNQYRNNGIKSHQHDSISKYLDSIGIIHENEYGKTLSKYNVEMGRIYSPRVDIFIPNKKIVIEIYGDSWHANPKSYKPTDEIYKWGGLKKAEDIWEHDNIRVRHIESSGYKVIILWCSDIMKSFEKVTKKLCKLLK